MYCIMLLLTESELQLIFAKYSFRELAVFQAYDVNRPMR